MELPFVGSSGGTRTSPCDSESGPSAAPVLSCPTAERDSALRQPQLGEVALSDHSEAHSHLSSPRRTTQYQPGTYEEHFPTLRESSTRCLQQRRRTIDGIETSAAFGVGLEQDLLSREGPRLRSASLGCSDTAPSRFSDDLLDAAEAAKKCKCFTPPRNEETYEPPTEGLLNARFSRQLLSQSGRSCECLGSTVSTASSNPPCAGGDTEEEASIEILDRAMCCMQSTIWSDPRLLSARDLVCNCGYFRTCQSKVACCKSPVLHHTHPALSRFNPLENPGRLSSLSHSGHQTSSLSGKLRRCHSANCITSCWHRGKHLARDFLARCRLPENTVASFQRPFSSHVTDFVFANSSAASHAPRQQNTSETDSVPTTLETTQPVPKSDSFRLGIDEFDATSNLRPVFLEKASGIAGSYHHAKLAPVAGKIHGRRFAQCPDQGMCVPPSATVSAESRRSRRPRRGEVSASPQTRGGFSEGDDEASRAVPAPHRRSRRQVCRNRALNFPQHHPRSLSRNGRKVLSIQSSRTRVDGAMTLGHGQQDVALVQPVLLLSHSLDLAIRHPLPMQERWDRDQACAGNDTKESDLQCPILPATVAYAICDTRKNESFLSPGVVRISSPVLSIAEKSTQEIFAGSGATAPISRSDWNVRQAGLIPSRGAAAGIGCRPQASRPERAGMGKQRLWRGQSNSRHKKGRTDGVESGLAGNHDGPRPRRDEASSENRLSCMHRDLAILEALIEARLEVQRLSAAVYTGKEDEATTMGKRRVRNSRQLKSRRPSSQSEGAVRRLKSSGGEKPSFKGADAAPTDGEFYPSKQVDAIPAVTCPDELKGRLLSREGHQINGKLTNIGSPEVVLAEAPDEITIQQSSSEARPCPHSTTSRRQTGTASRPKRKQLQGTFRLLCNMASALQPNNCLDVVAKESSHSCPEADAAGIADTSPGQR